MGEMVPAMKKWEISPSMVEAAKEVMDELPASGLGSVADLTTQVSSPCGGVAVHSGRSEHNTEDCCVTCCAMRAAPDRVGLSRRDRCREDTPRKAQPGKP
jgi:hypothetical protein